MPLILPTQESRIHKFILRAWTKASELDLSAMERLGVKVRSAEYATEGEGVVLMLVHLDGKMRRSDIMKRLLGCDPFPYNAICGPDQKVEELRGVEMLVASGETKVEYQQVFAAHFVAGSAGGEVKKTKAPAASAEDGGSAGMYQMLDRWGAQVVSLGAFCLIFNNKISNLIHSSWKKPSASATWS